MAPWASLTYVIVINGKATLNAEGRVALIRKAGHSITGEATPEHAVVHGKRRDTGDEMSVEWTMEMARRAGLDKQGPWRQYPEAMLWARAVSQLSRMLFADVLMGVSYDPEEMGGTFVGDVIDVSTEPLADAGCHEDLRNMLRALEPDQQAEMKAWLAANEFPPFGEHDRLTESQADRIAARIEEYPESGVLDPACECGHARTAHNSWWDLGDAESNGGPSSGMGCDECDCNDVRSPA